MTNNNLNKNSWKNTPLTIGILVSLIIGVSFVINLFVGSQEEMKKAAKEAVQLHCDRDVDYAHIDLKERYVRQAELNGQLHGLDKRLTIVEQKIEAVLRRLPHRRDE